MKASIEQLAFSIKKNDNIKFDEDTLAGIKFASKRFSTNAKKICFSHRSIKMQKYIQ